jgi:hypothetical protein
MKSSLSRILQRRPSAATDSSKEYSEDKSDIVVGDLAYEEQMKIKPATTKPASKQMIDQLVDSQKGQSKSFKIDKKGKESKR